MKGSIVNTAGLLALAGMLAPASGFASDIEITGKIGYEQRFFIQDGLYAHQLEDTQASIFIEPEIYLEWNGGVDTITFKPFVRQDEFDSERSHVDIRELSYVHASDNWELRAGVRKEFWGVTEFQHLVDVINQTDSVEDIDGEDKLGQLMLNLSLVRDWGIVDLYLLPGFRERTFSDENGRLRAPLIVDQDQILYESSEEDKHIDLAVRWTQTVGDFDIGAYWFHGTNRDPLLTLRADGEQVLLQQYYSQMDQFGFDAQATMGDWLWKFESIFRSTDADDFWATQAGFEYSFIGVFDSNVDVGWLAEYAWDSRGDDDETAAGVSNQNDVFLGSRIAFNDMQSSEILMGLGADLDHSAFSFLVEANRRIGENFKVSVDVRFLQSSD
jgi:hypothetical protein